MQRSHVLPDLCMRNVSCAPCAQTIAYVTLWIPFSLLCRFPCLLCFTDSRVSARFGSWLTPFGAGVASRRLRFLEIVSVLHRVIFMTSARFCSWLTPSAPEKNVSVIQLVIVISDFGVGSWLTLCGAGACQFAREVKGLDLRYTAGNCALA